MKEPLVDILIVGSGPSGVQAAIQGLKSGLSVGLLDIGNTPEDDLSVPFPETPFHEIRESHPKQADLFLGSRPTEFINWQNRAGAHLTPGRLYMVKDSDAVLPMGRSSSFSALNSTGRGGLGISWGANCFAYEDSELSRIGINSSSIRPYYEAVARDIGISGDQESDIASFVSAGVPLQGPLDIDTNAKGLLNFYKKRRDSFNKQGFFLGQSAIASLSTQLENRNPNPYFDLDFWADIGRSVYRPQFDIEKMRLHPRFVYLTKRVAVRFEERNDGVSVFCRNLESSKEEIIHCKRLMLAAGALNSGRLVLQSTHSTGVRLPLLCNPNFWIAAINLGMLGKNASDRRYSLSQLTGIQKLSNSGEDLGVAHFYSYRSLLFFRLLPLLPLPPKLGMIFLRTVQNALTLVNVHFPDAPSNSKSVQLAANSSLITDYDPSIEERNKVNQGLRTIKSNMLKLMCIPLSTSRPTMGASIHYAGTLPFSSEAKSFCCDTSGRLHHYKFSYVADGSTWRFLPGKGLTFTLMANARRVAANVTESLLNA